MRDVIEILAALFGIAEGFSLLMAIAVLIGLIDELLPKSKGWDWASVLQAILFFSVQATIAYFLVLGITWLLRTQGSTHLDPWAAHQLCNWGFRTIAFLGIMRVIWPRKHWSQNTPTPPHARLKLLGLALLAGALSFLPHLLPV